MYGDMMSWGGGWGFFGMVHMVLWWLLLVLGIVVLAKWVFGGAGGRKASEDQALNLLRERYARGDIGKEEFESRKRDLST